MTRRHHARIEPMEVRRLLSTVVVNTLADETMANSTTSLREAIQVAGAGDTVQFLTGLSGQITLSKGELVIGKNLTIAGPGAAAITVSGNASSRVFRVNSEVTASVSGLTITNGKAETGGGVYIDPLSKLTLSKVTLVGNNARGVDGDATNGGDAKGGGVYVGGALDVTDSEFRANGAIGGEGHIGIGLGNGGNAAGGAVYVENDGVLTALRTKFIDNGALGGVADGDFGAFGGGNGGYAQGGAVLNTNEARFTGCTF
jgi:CSLREA domain-containing protein